MKIIEGLKELKLIESRMKKNAEQIEKYSSVLDTERCHFENEAVQTREVEQLVQANKDLQERYLQLKISIEHTNLATKVQIEGQKKDYSIYELIIIKRKLGSLIKQTYEAMNRKQADMRRIKSMTSQATPVKVITLYDERKKNEALENHEKLMSNIDGRLEVVNAVTDLIE